MGCNQSINKDHDSDTDSTSSIDPFERTPFNQNDNINNLKTVTSSSNLNNVNNDLHKINVTSNGTLSPRSKALNKNLSKFPKISSSTSTHEMLTHEIINSQTRSNPHSNHNKYPQNPVQSDNNNRPNNYRLHSFTADTINHKIGTRPTQSLSALQHKQNLQKYRTKKVTVYKPQLRVPDHNEILKQQQKHEQLIMMKQKTYPPDSPKSPSISDISDDEMKEGNYNHKKRGKHHGRQKSKDDLTLHLHFNMRRRTSRRNYGYRSRYNQQNESRLPTIHDSEARSLSNKLGLHRTNSTKGSYHLTNIFTDEHETEMVTDLEDSDDDRDYFEDNGTIVQHDSSNGFDSDDSYWDAMYMVTQQHHHHNRKKSNRNREIVTHRRQATYHAYGGDDDEDEEDDESQSGIGVDYDDELSDDSLNRMARIATGFNEDHPMANSSDDDTDDETAMLDNVHNTSNRTAIINSSPNASSIATTEVDTPTVLVHDSTVLLHDSDTTTDNNGSGDDETATLEDLQFRRHTVGPGANAEVQDIQMSKPRYSTQVSNSITNTDTDTLCGTDRDIMRSPSTESIVSNENNKRSVISNIDKTSISIHQIDKAAFLQRILRNSINKHKTSVQEKKEDKVEKERMKKELKLQETHRTSNLKVIDDNTIAINIGFSKVIHDAPIPEGDEEEYTANDEHYENQSDPDEEDEQQSDTDTDPETAMLDFNTPVSKDKTGLSLKLDEDINDMDRGDSDGVDRGKINNQDAKRGDLRKLKRFKVIVDGIGLYQDMNLTNEIFTVQLKNGEIVYGDYVDFEGKIVLLDKWKLYISGMGVIQLPNEGEDKREQINQDRMDSVEMEMKLESVDDVGVDDHQTQIDIEPIKVVNDINDDIEIETPETHIIQRKQEEDEGMDKLQAIIHKINTTDIDTPTAAPSQPEDQTQPSDISLAMRGIKIIETDVDAKMDGIESKDEVPSTPEIMREEETKEEKSESKVLETTTKTKNKKSSKVNALKAKYGGLNIDPSRLKPGAAPKLRARPRSRTTGDIDEQAPKFEQITIRRGKRKKRSKRRKIKVALAPCDNMVAPKLFKSTSESNVIQDMSKMMSSPRNGKPSLMDQYRDQILENKDEILKIIQKHKENKRKKAAMRTPIIDSDTDNETTPLKSQGNNNKPSRIMVGEDFEKTESKHQSTENNISVDSEIIEAYSADISKIINNGKKTKNGKQKQKKSKNGKKSPRSPDLDQQTIIKYKDDIKKILKQNDKAHKIAFRPRAESALPPSKQLKKKRKLKPKPIQTRPIYFDKTKRDILMKRKKSKTPKNMVSSSKSRSKRSAPRQMKRRNIPKFDNKMIKSASMSPTRARDITRREQSQNTPQPKKKRDRVKSPKSSKKKNTKTKDVNRNKKEENYQNNSMESPIVPSIQEMRKIQSSPQRFMTDDLPTPTTPEFMMVSQSVSPVIKVISDSKETGSPENITNNGQVIKARISFKDRMAMYQQTSSGIGVSATQRLKKIKAERRELDRDVSLSEEQRERASELLQEYATKKAKHIADVTLIDKTMKGITKNNAIEKLEILGIITYIYVPINEFERWNNRNTISNMIDCGENNESKYRKYPNKYIKMANITLLNSKILIKLAEEQKELFKTLILYGLEKCQLIYKINFNAANITNPFLDKILNILTNRNKIIFSENDKHLSQLSLNMSPTSLNGIDSDDTMIVCDEIKPKQNEKWFNPLLIDKKMFYGPELFLVENNPISERGVELVCKYVSQNGLHLKCLKVGHCFGTISTNLCGEFCQSLQNNHYILKVTFDMRWAQHRQSVDKSLKRNYTKYRNQQKIWKKSIAH